jgi:hypothetical protein
MLAVGHLCFVAQLSNQMPSQSIQGECSLKPLEALGIGNTPTQELHILS